MAAKLAITFPLAFGLSFNVTRNPDGFLQPAYADRDIPLFGDLRLLGLANAVTCGFAEKLIMVGGHESSIKMDRPEAIRHMLIELCGNEYINRIQSVPSSPNTAGNVASIQHVCRKRNINPDDVAVITNAYHIPRALMDFHLAGIRPDMVPAEALLFFSFEEEYGGECLRRAFGNNGHTTRMIAEMRGIADKIRGSYQN